MTIAPSFGNELQLSVRRIMQNGFYINEPLFAKKQAEHPNEMLQVQLALQLAFTIEQDLVFLVVSVFYRFPNTGENEMLADISVQNVFELCNLKQFQVGPSEILLPPNLISTIVGLSLSHTRALMARNISGTALQENLMAIVDPTTVAKHFFPNMFAEIKPAGTS